MVSYNLMIFSASNAPNRRYSSFVLTPKTMEPSPWIRPAPVIQKFSVILNFSDFCIDTLHILNPSEMEECRNLKLDVFFVCFRVKADAPRSQMAPEITEDTKRGVTVTIIIT
jgi:hypothetical protein